MVVVNSFYELSAYDGPGILYSFLYIYELFKFPDDSIKQILMLFPFFLTYEQTEA